MNQEDSTETPPQPVELGTGFGDLATELLSEVEALRSTIGSLMSSSEINAKFSVFRLRKFVEDNATPREDEDGQAFDIPAEALLEFRRLKRQADGSTVAIRLVPESLLILLISRYDAFLGKLIRHVFTVRPELLRGKDKTLTLAELDEVEDIQAAKECLIEKEVESVLRKSHSDHFEWLETLLEMPLRKGLDSWKSFVELTERRNLFAHCDGVVSRQYRKVCRDVGVAADQLPSLNSHLDVPPNYFREACECVIEIYSKLCHVLWRKLLPAEREQADESLNSVAYELIIRGRYGLAKRMLLFATEVVKSHATIRHKLTFVVNLAQCHKWLGEEAECEKLLASTDWSAIGSDFRLCEAVLRDDYSRAAELIKEIGTRGVVSDSSYCDWPIFQKARSNEDFKAAFSDVFGKPLMVHEAVSEVNRDEFVRFLKDMEEKGSDSAGEESEVAKPEAV